MRAHSTIAAWRPEDNSLPPSRSAGRSAGFISDVIVPAAESAITGLLLATLVVAIAGMLHPALTNSGTIWLIAWIVATTVTWLIILRHTRNLLWIVERTTRVDIDGDGRIGRPGQRVILMNPRRAREEAEARTDREERQRFRNFVASLTHRGTDLRSWEKILGRDTYQYYRDTLFAEGYAAWANGKNDRSGWKLIMDVQTILDSIVD